MLTHWQKLLLAQLIHCRVKDMLQEMTHMITYSRLWLLLKRRGYSPRDIIHLAGISESTYRKMSRNEPVRMDVLERICAALRVDVGDVCSFSTLPAPIR